MFCRMDWIHCIEATIMCWGKLVHPQYTCIIYLNLIICWITSSLGIGMNEEHVWWRVVSHVWGQELECWDTGASAHGPRGNKTNVIRPPCSGSSLDRPRQCENCVMGKQLGNKTHKEMLTREKLVFWSITEQILGNTLSQHPHSAT